METIKTAFRWALVLLIFSAIMLPGVWVMLQCLDVWAGIGQR